MKFIADLHIHSHLSRATSRAFHAVLGVNEKLEPAEPGLFVLKKKYAQDKDEEVPESCRVSVRFMLSVEISNIYKKRY